MARFPKILVVTALSTLVVTGVFAATQIGSNLIRCAAKGVFYGQMDGLCFDAALKAPMFLVNGSVDSVPDSSLMVHVKQDFLGNYVLPDIDTADADQGTWSTQDTATAGCPILITDLDDGQLELLLDNGNEVGDCTLYWGNEQNIDSDKEPVCIFRVMVSDATVAADTVSWGLMNAYNALIESTANNAMFMVVGADLGLDVSSDDASTDTGVDTTGVTLTIDTFYEFKVSLNAIDGASATNVKFFYRSSLGGDWTALNTSTTYSIGADASLQPFVQIEKTSGTSTPGLRVDYIDCYWERT